MCSHPEFDDEMLPLSKGDALEGATLREGDICGRTAIPPNARNTQNIAAEYLLSKTTSIRIGRYEHLRRSIRTSAPVDADVCVGRCAPCKLRKTLRLLRILNYFCNFANIYILMYNQTKQEYQ